jgi:hypothetical protein
LRTGSELMTTIKSRRKSGKKKLLSLLEMLAS